MNEPDERQTCPDCGRPNSAKLGRCLYCGGTLEGAAVEAPSPYSATPGLCPHCRAPMSDVTNHGEEINARREAQEEIEAIPRAAPPGRSEIIPRTRA